MTTQMKIEAGSKVKWASQAQGHHKEKVGVVVQVVPAGERPNRERFLDLYKGAGVGCGRNHESYVVAVPTGKKGMGKPKHYWPRVSALRDASIERRRAIEAALNDE